MHTPRNGDVVQRELLQIEKNAINKNLCSFATPYTHLVTYVWDLSNLETRGKISRQKYKMPVDTLPYIGALEYGTRYYYSTNSDTLNLLAQENGLMSLNYDRPETRLIFPISVGDRIEGLFHATGTYCDKLHLRSCGRYSVVAEVQGQLVCLNGDTLRNVLRLHSTRFTVQQHFPLSYFPSDILEFTTDSIYYLMHTGCLTLREDVWRWYAPGYRYPILEVFSKNYLPEQDRESFAVWYCSPEEQKLLPLDDINMADRQWQNLYARTTPPNYYQEKGNASQQNDTKGNKIIRYKMENNVYDQSLHITYSLSSQASIKFVLADSMGIVYHFISRKEGGGQQYMNINYSSLNRGQYIIYICCNEQVFIEKFNVE